MKNYFGGCLLIMAVVLTACSKSEKRLVIPEGASQFSVAIPCHQPKVEKPVVNFKHYAIPTTVYQCNGLEYAYVITYSRYPVEIYKEYAEQELLDDVVHRLTHRDPPFEYISKKFVDLHGKKAVDIRMRIISPRAMYQNMVFFMNDAIYQVAFSSRPESFDSERKDAFYSSIRFAK